MTARQRQQTCDDGSLSIPSSVSSAPSLTIHANHSASRSGAPSRPSGPSASITRLVTALARQAAAEHHRRAFGFSIWETAPVLLLVAAAVWVLTHVFAVH